MRPAFPVYCDETCEANLTFVSSLCWPREFYGGCDGLADSWVFSKWLNAVTNLAFTATGLLPMLASNYGDDLADLASAMTAVHGVGGFLAHATELRAFEEVGFASQLIAGIFFFKGLTRALFPFLNASATMRAILNMTLFSLMFCGLCWNSFNIPPDLYNHSELTRRWVPGVATPVLWTLMAAMTVVVAIINPNFLRDLEIGRTSSNDNGTSFRSFIPSSVRGLASATSQYVPLNRLRTFRSTRRANAPATVQTPGERHSGSGRFGGSGRFDGSFRFGGSLSRFSRRTTSVDDITKGERSVGSSFGSRGSSFGSRVPISLADRRKQQQRARVAFRWVTAAGTLVGFIGGAAFFVDRHMVHCPRSPLHAVWHLCMAYAILTINCVIRAQRGRHCGFSVRLRGEVEICGARLILVPHVTWEKPYHAPEWVPHIADNKHLRIEDAGGGVHGGGVTSEHPNPIVNNSSLSADVLHLNIYAKQEMPMPKMKYDMRHIRHRLFRGDSVLRLPTRKTEVGRREAAKGRLRAAIRTVGLVAMIDPSEATKRRVAMRKLRRLKEFGQSFCVVCGSNFVTTRGRHRKAPTLTTAEATAEAIYRNAAAAEQQARTRQPSRRKVWRKAPSAPLVPDQKRSFVGQAARVRRDDASKPSFGKATPQKRKLIGEWLRAGQTSSTSVLNAVDAEDNTQVADAANPVVRGLQRSLSFGGKAAGAASDSLYGIIGRMNMIKNFGFSKARAAQTRARTAVCGSVRSLPLPTSSPPRPTTEGGADAGQAVAFGADEPRGGAAGLISSYRKAKAGKWAAKTMRQPRVTVAKGPKHAGKETEASAMRVREAQARVAAARESHGRDKTSVAGASKRAAHGAAPAPAPAAVQPHKVDDDKKTADATMSVVDLDDEFE